MAEIDSAAQEIVTSYHILYEKIHTERSGQYQDAVEKTKGRPK